MPDKRHKIIRIVFSCIVLLTLQTHVYAKSDINETNVTAVQLQDTQDMDSEVDGGKIIIGRIEKVTVLPGDITFKARIDTGATTTSLGADEIKIVNEDGKDWAEVKIDDTKIKLKVRKYILIKQHGTESKRRPVVRMRLTLGDVSEVVNVTLADRSNFDYQLLIGRNFLYDRFIVDVSLKYTIKSKTKSKKDD